MPVRAVPETTHRVPRVEGVPAENPIFPHNPVTELMEREADL